MISNSFEWFTVDSDGRHVVEGTSEPMFPVAAVALITLLSRLGDASVSEIVRPTINEICNRLFLARARARIHAKKIASRAILLQTIRGQSRYFYGPFRAITPRNLTPLFYTREFLFLCTHTLFALYGRQIVF